MVKAVMITAASRIARGKLRAGVARLVGVEAGDLHPREHRDRAGREDQVRDAEVRDERVGREEDLRVVVVDQEGHPSTMIRSAGTVAPSTVPIAPMALVAPMPLKAARSIPRRPSA